MRLPHSRSSSFAGTPNGALGGSVGRSEAGRLQSEADLAFGKYAESDDEDYEDVFGKHNGTGEQQILNSVVAPLMSDMVLRSP